MDKHLLVAIILTTVVKIDSARILAVYPIASISHQVVFRPVTQELVKRGHEVVVITTDPAFPPGEAPANLKEIDVGNVSYYSWRNALLNADVGKCNDLHKQVRSLIKVFKTMFEDQLQIKEIEDIVKNSNNETFDLLLLEMCVRPALAFFHVYKAPIILFTSNAPLVGMYEKVGIPSNPLLYPTVPRQRLYNLSLWEKMKEVISFFYIAYIYGLAEMDENEMLKKYFGPDIPPLSEIYNHVDMVYQNIYPILMDNPPVSPNIIYMGGLHQKKAKELSQDWNLYLNTSKTGVIYVSFGTNVKTSLFPPEKVQMMIKVFSNLPYDVLWKMDNEELSGISKNIKISKWFPQADLLKHPKIKAFVMQGGQQSTDEAITAGVPLIGIPIYADQWFNVEKYIHHKIGLKLDWDSLTEEEFRSAILTVAEDTSYQKNVRRLRSIINDQFPSSLERAMLWTEHILRHGGAKHLRAPAANMSWIEYYEIHLVVILIISLIFAKFCLLFLLYFMWMKVLNIYSKFRSKCVRPRKS